MCPRTPLEIQEWVDTVVYDLINTHEVSEIVKAVVVCAPE